jgi:hypothetical protein
MSSDLQPSPMDADPTHTALLEAHSNARQDLQVAQVNMNAAAMSAAEQRLDDVSCDILKYEQRQAAVVMRGLRFAHRHHPETLRAILNEAIGGDVLRDDLREMRSDVDEVIEKLADTIATSSRMTE